MGSKYALWLEILFIIYKEITAHHKEQYGFCEKSRPLY